MAEEGRDKYLASKAYKRPVGSFTQRDDIREFAGSGPGRNLFSIQELQRQAPTFAKDDPRIDDLKQRRRTWNRYQKYPAGEMLGRTPQQMQNEYMGLSRDLRQTAKPVYDRMYPITGKFMDVAEKGGLWGALLSEIAGKTKKRIKDFGDSSYSGITSALAGDTPEEKAEYVEKTFGPYPSDVHPGLPVEEDRFVAPPDDILPSDATADIIESDTFSILPYHSKRSMFPRDNKRVIPGIPEPMPLQEDLSLDITVPLQTQEPLPFDDSVREAGIASLYGQGPQWGSTNRRYEDEYRNYVERLGDMPGGPMTYEEFVDEWEGIHQGKPHAGLR